MQTRKPAVAGQFYAGSQEQCLTELKECLGHRAIESPLPDTIVAGIVPHAGWVFSGDLAGMVFSAIKHANIEVDTFVIFGAAHRYVGSRPVAYGSGTWQTPIGQIEVDEDLAKKIVATGFATDDKMAHAHEHSIEVQIPFIQYLFPAAKIVPIIVPPINAATDFGEEVGNIIAAETETGKKIVCIASTDLTHYGPRYGFYPQGSGPEAIKWAKDVNDMEFIDLAVAMKADKLLLSAEENASACGSGAAAAVVAAAKSMGRSEGILLAHTHSCEVMEEKYHQTSDESVGYAAIVY